MNAPVDTWIATRDGRRLFAQGHGQPALDGAVVVFEAGMGVSRNEWGAVVEDVSQFATTVAYDRSGLGRSAPDPRGARERGLDQLTSDLIDVLEHVGADRYILVGHSWGGPIVRNAASIRPDLIAGLVLVDQTDEKCDLFFSSTNERQTRFALATTVWLARLGVTRLVARRFARLLPEPWASGMRGEDGTVAATKAQLAELRPCTSDLAPWRDDPPELPDVPVAVISGMHVGWMERGRRPAVIDAHRASADALPQGRHVEAPNSGHYVPLTEPEVVTAEIRRIIEQL